MCRSASKWGPVNYGYKAYVVRLTQVRESEALPFNHQHLGEGGAMGLLETHLGALQEGASDEARGQYTRIDSVHVSNWGLLVEVIGGPFGTTADVIDTRDHSHKTAIAAHDAVLSPGRLLIVLPPDERFGVLIAETRGGSHHTTSFLSRLNGRLAENSLKLRLDAQITDGLGWARAIEEERAEVLGVEFVTLEPSRDGTGLTDSPITTKGRLVLDLVPGAETGRKILSRLGSRSTREERLGAGKVDVASMVGLRGYVEDYFEQEFLTVRVDGRRRKINVTRGWPTFTYLLGEERPSDADLLSEVRDTVTDVLRELEIDTPVTGWWPAAPTE